MRPRKTVLCLTCVVAALALLFLTDLVLESPEALHAAAVDIARPEEAGETDPQTHTVYIPLVEIHGWFIAPLVNGGFESNWGDDDSHDALVFETDGTVTQSLVDNIFTPPGWLTWFKQGVPVEHDVYNTEGWCQPEVRDAWSTNPDRMHSGAKGQLLFTFWKVHDAGFLQQVGVITGEQVRLSGWSHAWSNNGGPPEKPDDPYWSEGSHVGYNQFYAIEGTEGLDGGDQNITFWLGIDPTGGMDPYSETVVWGQGAHIYNSYRHVPTVTTTAAGPTITVFLRSRTLWRFKHNDVYWDDIQLEVFR